MVYIARLVLHVWCMVTEYNVWLVSGRRQTQCFEKLRLAGAWWASGAMFWNHTSGAMFQNQASGATFQNLLPGAIFQFSKCCVWQASDGCMAQCFEIMTSRHDAWRHTTTAQPLVKTTYYTTYVRRNVSKSCVRRNISKSSARHYFLWLCVRRVSWVV